MGIGKPDFSVNILICHSIPSKMMFLEVHLHPLSAPMGWGLDEHNFSVQIWIFHYILQNKCNTLTSIEYKYGACIELTISFFEQILTNFTAILQWIYIGFTVNIYRIK